MIAPFFIAGFDTPSDLCCRIRLYNKGLCPLTPEFIALGFRRSKKEQHQVLLLQTSNNNYGWYQYHAGIFGKVNSTPYPCKSKFQSEIWDNWNLVFQLTHQPNLPKTAPAFWQSDSHPFPTPDSEKSGNFHRYLQSSDRFLPCILFSLQTLPSLPLPVPECPAAF